MPMMGKNEKGLHFSGLLMSPSLWSGVIDAILKDIQKFPSSKRLLKSILRTKNPCRQSFDKDVVPIIALCALLLLSPSNSRSNFFHFNFPKKIEFNCFALCVRFVERTKIRDNVILLISFCY